MRRPTTYSIAQRVGLGLFSVGALLACARLQQLGIGTDVQLFAAICGSTLLLFVAIAGEL